MKTPAGFSEGAGPVLAADTSAGHCSAALLGGGAAAVSAVRVCAHGHAELLAVMVRDVLDEAGVRARGCARFAAVTGPGSFTGVRAGVSFMRALALAAGRPVLGVDAFTAWAATAGAAGGPLIVALDSRRGTVYVRETPGGGAAAEESLDALAARLARTPGARLAGNAAPPGAAGAFERAPAQFIDPAAVAAVAAAARPGDPAFAPRPFYLRPPDAQPPAAPYAARR